MDTASDAPIGVSEGLRKLMLRSARGRGAVPLALHEQHELLAPDELSRFDAVRDRVRRDVALQRHRASADARVLQMSVAALRSQA